MRSLRNMYSLCLRIELPSGVDWPCNIDGIQFLAATGAKLFFTAPRHSWRGIPDVDTRLIHCNCSICRLQAVVHC